MSPATFNDVTGGRQTFGNPELCRATIDHLDLRWELYPRPGESISIAGFAKRFTQPVESIVVVSAQHLRPAGAPPGCDRAAGAGQGGLARPQGAPES